MGIWNTNRLTVKNDRSRSKRRRIIARAFERYRMEGLEERVMLSGVTAISFRSDLSGTSPVPVTALAGQTVYIRVDADGMVGQTVNLSVWEEDGLIGDDEVATSQTIKPVTIGADGYGVTAWEASWQGDDGSTQNNQYYAYYANGLLPGVYSSPLFVSPSAGSGRSFSNPLTYNWDDTIPTEGVIEGTITRVDQNAPIDPSANTWIVIHGRQDSSDSLPISKLADAVSRATGGQVLTLDWRGGASAINDLDFTGEAWIRPVADWAARALKIVGFSGNSINLVGHSWGAVLSAELAAFIGGVNRIIALDPAEDASALTGGTLYDTSGVDFAAHSNYSLAFLSSEWGSAKSAETASASFKLDIVGDAWAGINAHAHSHARDIFSAILDRNNEGSAGMVSRQFAISNLSTATSPWLDDCFLVDGVTGAVIPGVGLGRFEGVFHVDVNDNPNVSGDIIVTPRSLEYYDLSGHYQLVTEASQALPDLAPVTPTGWSSPIVISTTRGSIIDSSEIHSDQRVYVDWAAANQGSLATVSQFHVRLYLDGTELHVWYVLPPLAPGSVTSQSDYQFGPLSAGEHTLKVVVDCDNEIIESGIYSNMFVRQVTVLPTPVNDAFGAAQVLMGSVATTTGRNTDGSKEVGEPNHAGNQGGASVWYKWTASSGAAVTVDSRGSSFDTLLGVYTSGVSALVLTASSDDVSTSDHTSRLTFIPISGTTYYIAVDGKNSGQGPATGNIILRLQQVGASLPDLAQFAPSDWSGSIVASTVTGTTTNSIAIHPGAYVYVDFAITNQGQASTTFQYFAKLLVDQQFVDSWYFTAPQATGAWKSVADAQVTPLTVGNHIISIVIDYVDYIPESNETNNTFTKTITVAPAPANNNFSDASPLMGLNAAAIGTNSGADEEVAEPTHNGTGGGASVWYKWTAPVSGSVKLDTRGSDFNTVLAVYTGGAVGLLTTVGSNDDASVSEKASAVTFNAVAGTTYYFAVDGWANSSGVPATGNLKIQLTETPFKPNLTPYAPSGWAGSLVLSTVSGSNSNAAYIHPGETVYVDWAVINQGQADTTAAFKTSLVVDDTFVTFWTSNPPVTANHYQYITDYHLAPLSLGPHTITLTTDYLGAIDESVETDNSITRNIVVVAKPANDDFAAAIVIAGQTGSAVGTTVGATKETGEPNHFNNTGGSSIWYKWTAPVTGTANFDTHGSGFDTILAAYTGTTVGALTEVASNDDDPSQIDKSSLISFPAIAGIDYYVAVDGYNGKVGTLAVHLAMSFPDIAPYAPAGWSSPLVISTISGSRSNASVIHATDTLYVDWAVRNQGTVATAAKFFTRLLLDGQQIASWYTNAGLIPQDWGSISDSTISPLAAGIHTLTLDIDYHNDLPETVETNNSITRTFTVGIPLALVMTPANNNVYVRRDGDTIHADVWVNSSTPGVGTPTQQALISDLSNLSMTGGIGDESLTLDFSNGNPLSAGGVLFDGGGGANKLIFIGSTGNDTVNANATGVVFSNTSGTRQVTNKNVQTIQFVGGSGGDDTFAVAAGVTCAANVTTASGVPNISVIVGAGAYLAFIVPQRLKSLTVDGGTARLSNANATDVTSLNLLTLANGGKLDVANQDLLLDRFANSADSVRQLLVAGFNGGTWNGAGGIVSGTVAANLAAGWTLGYLDGFGGGAGVPNDKVLVRRTLSGDANLDRNVAFADLVAVAQHYGATTGATFAQGDFNYDGKVDFQDLVTVAQKYSSMLSVAAGTPVFAAAAIPSPVISKAKKLRSAVSPFSVTPVTKPVLTKSKPAGTLRRRTSFQQRFQMSSSI